MLAVFTIMLILTAGTTYAAPVTIGGNICAGAQKQVFDATGAPAVDPVLGGPVYEPDMNCTPVANAAVSVESDGQIVAYGTVLGGGAWSASFDDADPLTGDYIGPFTVMYSAPNFDATSRQYDTRGAASTLSGACAHTMCQNAYLPPLPHKKARLLVYSLKDDYINTEDDWPADPALNCVKMSAYREGESTPVAEGYTGTQTPAELLPLADAPDGLYYFNNLEPGNYEVKADPTYATKDPVTSTTDCTTLPTSPYGWIQNSTLEGGFVEEATLYPGDPGLIDGGYYSWFSFIENLGSIPPDPAEQGANTISGIVLDADGMVNCLEPWAPTNPYVTPNNAVQDALVVLWSQNPPPTDLNPAGAHAVAVTYTDANGNFTFSNVANGNYRVFFVDKDLSYIWQETQVTVANNAGADLGFLHMPRWWARITGYVMDVTGVPNTSDPTAHTVFGEVATPISVTYSNLAAGWGCPGATTPTTIAPTYTVCTTNGPADPSPVCEERPVKIVDPVNSWGSAPDPAVTGTPISNVSVALRRKDGSIWKTAVTDANGHYVFDGLNEIEVLGYVTVEEGAETATRRGAVVTDDFPTITHKVYGISPVDNRKFTVPYEDLTDINTYTFNLSGRSLNWYASNYQANLHLEQVPVASGDIRGYVYYDSLTPGTWQPDGVYVKDEERVLPGVTVNLFSYDDTDPLNPVKTLVATTTSGDKDETALFNQGYKPLGRVFPADEFAGVFKGDTIGFYEFRDLLPGRYVVEADVSTNNYFTTTSSDGSTALDLAGGAALEANLGLVTGPTATAAVRVPLSGEIEGGVFDDLHLQGDGESILWDEKMPLKYAPVSIYDHMGYFLGAVTMGNDLCSEFSDHVTDPNVCPNGEESPELEYHAAPGPHIFVGNDPSEWLTNYQFTSPDGDILDENGMPILDVNGNPIQGPTYYTYNAKSPRDTAIAPWLPGGVYYPEFAPLPWTYSFDQGKFKYEADWSLLPYTIGVPLPDPIRNFAGTLDPNIGGLLGNGAIAPQGQPVITSAVVENLVDPALTSPVMLAMNYTDGTATDAADMLAMLPAYTVTNSSGATKVMHINGMNFGSTKDYSTVTLSGTMLHVWKWSDTSIDVLLTEGAKSGPLMVATYKGISNTLPVNIISDDMHERDHKSRSIYVDAEYGMDTVGAGAESNPFKTIGAALNALPNVRPVYVFVKPGVYKERVTIPRSGVRLIGYGPKETILDGAERKLIVSSHGAVLSGGQVVSIGRGGIDGSVEDVVISGFTIINGSANSFTPGGGGIFADYGNRDIDINNNIITHNGGEYGGGIWLHHSNHDVSIWSNLIAQNGNFGGYGGGISVNDEPEYEVPGAIPSPGEFDPTHHTYDDSMYSKPTGTYTIFNNRIVRNFSMDYGGGISLYEIKDELNIYGNMFVENMADDHGGALFFEDSGPANVYGNVFLWNTAPDDGGAISVEDVGDDNSTMNIYNNLFAENLVDDRAENTAVGGAIGLDDALYVNVFGNSIIGNVTAGTFEPRGGAIGAERHGHEYINVLPGFSDAKISNNIIWSNWRLQYDPPRPSMEALSFKMGVNYRWNADNLYNDDPRVNAEWESKNNSNSFTVAEENIISGGYAGAGNVDASSVFPDPTTISNWVVMPGSDNTYAAPVVDLQETLDSVRPAYNAPLTHPAIQSATTTQEYLRQALLINKASDVSGLLLAGSGSGATVNLTTSYENSLSNVTTAAATGIVQGVNFPMGVISYSVTSPKHGCVDTMFSFSTALPARLMLYRVSSKDEYEEVPYRRWTQTGANTYSLTLCDRDEHDDDHAANGVVSGKVAIGEVFNSPPVAVAGQDQTIFLGQTVTLDGSASYDDPADGTPVTSYEWTIEKGKHGTAAIADPTSAVTTFTPDSKGEYMISLKVGDGLFISPEDSMMIRVIDNRAPKARVDAVPDVGIAPSTVHFDASATTDEDVSSLTFDWNFGDGTVLNTGNVASADHTYTTAGRYKAIVTVTDNAANTDKDSVRITVNAGNTPPSVDPSADRTSVAPLQVLNFKANAADTENNIVSYSWDLGDGTTSADENPSHFYDLPGTYNVTLVVSDAEFTAEGSVVIAVGSAFSLDVNKATYKTGKRSHDGVVNMEGTFTYSGLPAAADVIKVEFDDVTLVETEFGSFVTGDPGVYEHNAKNTHVEINFNTSVIKVQRHKIDLGEVNNKNGIDIVVSFGGATATDSFKMKGNGSERSYKKRD